MDTSQGILHDPERRASESIYDGLSGQESCVAERTPGQAYRPWAEAAIDSLCERRYTRLIALENENAAMSDALASALTGHLSELLQRYVQLREEILNELLQERMVDIGVINELLVGTRKFAIDVESEARSRVENLRDAPQADRCVCGNIFMSDSLFCRRCGAKRPQDKPSPEIKLRSPRYSSPSRYPTAVPVVEGISNDILRPFSSRRLSRIASAPILQKTSALITPTFAAPVALQQEPLKKRISFTPPAPIALELLKDSMPLKGLDDYMKKYGSNVGTGSIKFSSGSNNGIGGLSTEDPLRKYASSPGKGSNALSSGLVCSCGSVLLLDAAFCRKCGQPRLSVETCPDCQEAYKADDRFCQKCGRQRSVKSSAPGSQPMFGKVECSGLEQTVRTMAPLTYVYHPPVSITQLGFPRASQPHTVRQLTPRSSPRSTTRALI